MSGWKTKTYNIAGYEVQENGIVRNSSGQSVGRLKDLVEATESPAPSGQAEFALLDAGPWPLKDVLAKLVEATNILLDGHSYDGHGWEQINAARDKAIKIMAGI